MLVIAHRGLLHGPDTSLENDPFLVQQLLDQGWHVEVDVRQHDHKWYLGHDAATHAVSTEFLIQPGLWIHVKDPATATGMHDVRRAHHHVNYFWHESDARTLTSQGHWWTQPGHPLVSNSVAVMPETHVSDLRECLQWPCVAVCTDWGSRLK